MKERLFYREEVTAVIGALAGMVVHLRNIDEALGEDGEEEEEED